MFRLQFSGPGGKAYNTCLAAFAVFAFKTILEGLA